MVRWWRGGGNAQGQTNVPIGLLLTPALDTDNDGVVDSVDAFPNDITASVDSDGDGYPDAWNTGYSAADSTSMPPLQLDLYPKSKFEYCGCNRTSGDSSSTD